MDFIIDSIDLFINSIDLFIRLIDLNFHVMQQLLLSSSPHDAASICLVVKSYGVRADPGGS